MFFAGFQSFLPLWHALSSRRRAQLFQLQLLGMAAAVSEAANLGAILPMLRLLANPEQGIKLLGPIAYSLPALPERFLLLIFGLGFIIIVAISTAVRLVAVRAQLRLAALITADLSDKVYATVLNKPFAWHLQQNSSNVLGFLTKDVEQANASIQALLSVLVNLAIVLMLGASLIFLSSTVMLVISGLLVGFYLFVFRFTKATLRSDGERLVSNYKSSLQVVQESLGGIRDVILDRSQAFFLNDYRYRNRSYRLAMVAINIKSQVPRYLIEGFTLILIVGLTLVLAINGQSIQQQLPLLGTLALGAYRLLQPLQQCFSALSTLQANQASLRRLQPFLQDETLPLLKLQSQTFRLPNLMEGQPFLSLQRLSFRYRSEGPWILRGLDLVIYQGERIAFVGTTGSGKSTISDLILGLLAPTEGQLLVYGDDLHANPRLVEVWQRRVAHVPQTIYLSDASFAANIAFGVPYEEIDHKRVRQAAEQARIAALIESSSEGYLTVVGERGVLLSGGQRQRIGLARALYKQAELLVLDEATSALDNLTEAEVMASIEGLNRHITVILIAHRLSTIKRCDRILLLEQGCIAGLGTYTQLLAENPTFQRLAYENRPSL